MTEENLYGVSDETIDKLEREIAHAEIDSETIEEFLDACFPEKSVEEKVKIAIFSERFYELFSEEEGEE